MTTLAKDKFRDFYGVGNNEIPVAANTKIFLGSAVGDNGSGYARPLQAGDRFLGFCEETVDNSTGAAGAFRVKVRPKGLVELPVTNVVVGDIGKPVFASDDDTFLLTQSTNSAIGLIHRFVSAGIAIVAFDADHGGLGGMIVELADNSTGAASDTIAAISDAATKNAIASLAAKVNTLIRLLGN